MSVRQDVSSLILWMYAGKTRNWHRESKAARSVLEQLYTDGVLLIHHKKGSRKYYDLTENYFDSALLQAENPCPDEAAFLRWRILRRIGAVGLLWNRRSDAWLGIEMSTEQRNRAFEELEASGLVIAVQVDGIRVPLYMLAEDAALMDAVRKDEIDMKARLEFLAPLDPMLWDRKLIEAVWDFKYSWEIYTPAEKRKYGYYVLPMVCGQELIGRIEAMADRKTNTLVVRNIWYEPGVRQTKKLDGMIDVSIRRLARFNECDQVDSELRIH